MKRILSILLAVVMLVGYVPHTHAQVDKVGVLQEKGIVNGRDGGALQLDKTLTRGEFMKLLVHASKIEALAEKADTQAQDFKDAPKTHWAFKYIALMRQYGIAKGVGEGKFKPDAPISYEQVIAFIVRLDKSFADKGIDQGKDWAKPYIDYAKNKGMLKGVLIDDYSKSSIRKDIFEIIYNALPILEKRNALHDIVLLKEREIGNRETKKIPSITIVSPDSGSKVQPKPEPKPDPNPGKDDTPEIANARDILGQFIAKAKSRIDGVKASDETDPSQIELGEVVATSAEITKLNKAIEKAEQVFQDPKATQATLEKAKGDLERATIDFKTIEGEKSPEIDTYVAEDFVIDGNILKGFTELGIKKLKKNKNILNIPVIDGVDTIGAGAFADKGIKVLEVPGNLKTIETNAFLKNGITKLTLNSGIENLKMRAFSQNNIKNLTIPGTLNNIGANAFAQSNVVNLVFEEGVSYIGESAFSENAISNISFPSTLRKIDLGAFKSNLVETVNFPDGLEEIAPKIFCRNKIQEVILPNSLKVFCGNSFRYNPGFEGDTIFKMMLKDVVEINDLDGKTIEEKLSEVVQLRPYIFKGHIKDEKTALGIESWELLKREGDISTYSATFEQISDEKLNNLLGPKKKDGTSNETVQENLRKTRLIVRVKITDDVLGVWKEDEFTTEGSKITGFSEKGKEKVKSNKRLVIPAIKGIDTIAKSAFRNSRPKLDLEYIEVPANIKIIEDAAFGVNPTKQLKLHEGLEKIGNQAFLAHEITSIDFPNSLKEIGDMAFMGNRKSVTLSEITLGKNIAYIGRNAFKGNGLKTLVLNENLKTIDVNAFDSNALTTVKFNKNLENLMCQAFGNN